MHLIKKNDELINKLLFIILNIIYNMKRESTININDQIVYEILDNKLFSTEFISGIAGDKILSSAD